MKLRCEWLTCWVGSGVAGNGTCFLGGAWWMMCCPEYQDEEEKIKEYEETAGLPGLNGSVL